MSVVVFHLCFHLSSAISITKNLSQIYYLTDGEYYSLLLNNYFSGDSLSYQIKDQNSAIGPEMQLNNASVYNKTLNNIGSGFQIPSKNTLCQTTCEFSQKYCNAALYAANDTFYVFSFDIYEGYSSMIFNITFENQILGYKVIKSNYDFIFLVTHDEIGGINKFYNVSFSIANGTISYNGSSPIHLSETLMHSNISDISGGIVEDSIAISAFYKKSGFIINIIAKDGFNESSPLIVCYNLTNSQILLAAGYHTYYALITDRNLLVLIQQESLENLLLFNNSLYLPSLEKTGYSLAVSTYYGNLFIIIGSMSKAIIVSSDFERVYVKNLTINESKVYGSFCSNYCFFLVQQMNSFSIHIIESFDSFNEIISYKLPIEGMNSTAWLSLNYFNDEYLVMFLDRENMVFINIQYVPAQLKFTRSETVKNYTLLVVDKVNNIQSSDFSVSPVNEIDDLVPLQNNQSVVINFDGITGSALISLYDYYAGSDIENASITCNDVDFIQNFNYSSAYSPLLNYSGSVELDPSKNFNEILESDEGVVLYSKDLIGLFKETGKYQEFKISNMEIIEILFNPSGHYLIYCKGADYGLISLSELSDLTSCPNNLEKKCITIVYSFIYIGCNVGEYIAIYEDIENTISLVSNTNTSLTYPEYIVDFCMTNPFIVTIDTTGNITFYDLSTLENSLPLNSLFTRYLGENPVSIFASPTNYYVYFGNSSIVTYDKNISYLKNTELKHAQNLVLLQNVLFASYSQGAIRAYNFSDFMVNSAISMYLYNDTIISYYPSNSNFFVLFRESYLAYQLNTNYNTLELTFTINNLNNISNIYYSFDIVLMVSQFQDINIYSNLRVILMTNGQTVFKNSSAIKTVNNTSLTCGTSTTFYLEEFFLGQNLEVFQKKSSDFVSIQKRLNETFNKRISYEFVDIIYLEDNQSYVGIVYPNYLVLLDSNFNKISEKQIGFLNSTCEAYSLAGVYIEKNLSVAVGIGCYINMDIENILFEKIIYFIQFIKLDGLEPIKDGYKELELKPSLMKSSLSVSGKFSIAITSAWQTPYPGSFYSNFLVICLGPLKYGAVFFNCSTIITSDMLGLASMYIVDIEISFYPVFQIYYLYLLNIEGNLIIVEFNTITGGHLYSIISLPVSNDVPVSICLSGNNLYIAYASNQILIYLLQTFNLPIFQSSISSLNDNFVVVPASLKCSSKTWANYLIFTMIRFEIYYVQVIDLTANELASIISQYNTNSSNSLALFSSPDKISLITSYGFSILQLQEYSMVVALPKLCKTKFLSFSLVGKNQINSEEAKFYFRLSNNYSQGSVSIYFPIWLVCLIIISAVIILVILTFQIRKMYKKKKNQISEQFVLFNYEFMEANL